MTKFIIIDNSIEDTVGHHFQYAAHCLKAASEYGHDAILATNKLYSNSQASQWRTFPVYNYGFWDTHDSSMANSLLTLNRAFSTRVNQLKYKAIFSWIGFCWENRGQLLSQTSVPGAAREMKNPIPWLVLSSIIVPLFLLSVRINHRLNKMKRALLNLSSRRQRDPITGTLIEEKRSKAFYKDTRTLFDRINLEKDDIVFIPTVGLTELLGLLEYFKKEPDSKLATWHMLFRRNIYTGRETEYWKQEENLRLLRNTLLHFTQSLEGHRIFFYTDTDELTAQYNRFGISSFYTLPVPHTMPASVEAGGDVLPLTVTYIGDARTEKGYHILPHIVNDLWSDYAMSGKVRFVLQSNFNVPKGEPKVVVARSDLESMPKEKVKLIYDALSFEEYTKLLLETDIMLLLYEPDNYYARSSGILVECLAAGIPVVVPSATWLSRQFIREIYRHQASLQKALIVSEDFSDSEILWKRQNSEVSPFVNDELIFGGEATKAYCWLEKPISSTLLYVSFVINAPIRSCIRVDIAQLRHDKTTTKFRSELIENLNDNIGTESDNTRSTTTTSTLSSSDLYSVVVPLESDCYRIWLGFKNAFGNNAMKLTRIKVIFLEPKGNVSKFPLGAVGLAYNNPYEISGLLRDIIDNYQHYRSTALAFSYEYLKVHNAGQLISEIKRNVNSVQ